MKTYFLVSKSKIRNHLLYSSQLTKSNIHLPVIQVIQVILAAISSGCELICATFEKRKTMKSRIFYTIQTPDKNCFTTPKMSFEIVFEKRFK